VLTRELREYAEVPERYAYVAPDGSVTRHDDGRACILQGTTWATVAGPNVAAHEVDDLIALVHERVPREKDTVWWLGPSSRPLDLEKRLRARGFQDATTPLLRALALTREPAAPPPEVEVRRVETLEDFVTAREVQWDAFAAPPERREKQRPFLATEFAETRASGNLVVFLAFVDERPAATGVAVLGDRGVFLIAGSTAPWARGRGCYRALVGARWDLAVELGTPALVTHAAPGTSYPILKRLGFEDVCTVRRLVEKEQ
jgi:hypothetical protein